MNTKIKKFIYELSQNARIRTKELGKKLKISQQSASYLWQSFQEKKKIRGYSAVIDPAKFGLLQVLVYLNYSDFDNKKIKEVVNFLKEDDNVVLIEDLKQGYDLAVVFCVPNLSLYNKKLRDFLQKFRNVVSLAETYPIIVKHMHLRKYLSLSKEDFEIIISGDRDIIEINDNEKKVLSCLYEKPTESVIEIHKKSKLNPKTITRVKKVLEENKIIRGYTTNFNLSLIGIRRKHLLISSRDLSLADDTRILRFCLTHSNVVSLIRLIGSYDILIEIEEETAKKDFLKDIRVNFPIHDYKMIECGEIIKNTYIPRSSFD